MRIRMTTAARQICKSVCISLLFIIVLITSQSECSDLLSRCSPKLPRTNYLKATDWGKCYEFHVEERTWKYANNICSSKGGHLVTIKEESVQRFLLKTLSDFRWPRNGIWIGASDKDKEMDWVWVTGERVKDGYSKWASGQPNCKFFCFEDCALMRWKEGGGEWHDYRCSWLEDYSFICEYDMMPEPSTTTIPTTTTTTNTTISKFPEATANNTTIMKTTDNMSNETNSNTLLSSMRVLNSEYLLHGHRENENKQKNSIIKEEKNNTDVGLHPVAIMKGVNGDRSEQIQESVSSSGLDSGSLALVIAAVLMILAVGLCLMLLVMRRRHRKLIREDDRGISYGNPYYEASPTSQRSDTHSDGNNTDTDDQDDFSGSDLVASGFTDTASCIKPTEKKQPPPHSSRPKRVMNNYDTPPTLTTHLPVFMNKNPYPVEKTTLVKADNPTNRPHMQEVTPNYYDEVRSQYANSQLAYDVPRASNHNWYKNNELDSDNGLPDKDGDMYYNFYDENIYESVDNLADMIEQNRHQPTTELLYVQNPTDEDSNRYVPFLLDTPKES
uniref:C-type lectin domain-containing protein n=1 Tax=Arion vulgaris TaxID=1028688 RepID=A0A0B7AF33_9EUPU